MTLCATIGCVQHDCAECRARDARGIADAALVEAAAAGMKLANELGSAMTAAYAFHATNTALRALNMGDEQGTRAVLELMCSEFARRAAIEEARGGQRRGTPPNAAERRAADRVSSVGDEEIVSADELTLAGTGAT